MENEKNTPFRMEGNKIISAASGNTVAVIDNGAVVIQSGYNPMTKKVQDFYESVKDLPLDPAADIKATAPEEQIIEDEEFLPEEEFARDHTAEYAAGNVLSDNEKTNIFVGDVPAAGGTSAPAQQVCSNPEADLVIDSIPDDELPELDPVLGTNTKSFKLFVKLYKLTPEQITALVRKLEFKLRG